MSLRDRLTAQPKINQCLTCKYLKQLPKDDADELAAAIANPDITGSAIAHALTLEGWPVSADSVQRHRKYGHDAE